MVFVHFVYPEALLSTHNSGKYYADSLEFSTQTACHLQVEIGFISSSSNCISSISFSYLIAVSVNFSTMFCVNFSTRGEKSRYPCLASCLGQKSFSVSPLS